MEHWILAEMERHIPTACLYCNFELKQAISITLFGRRPYNKERKQKISAVS